MRATAMNAMRAVKSLVAAVLAAVVFAVPSVVLADGRVALLVGNSTYAHIGRLPNPDNDARDMSAGLQRIGFEVTVELDADRVELTEALRALRDGDGRSPAGIDVGGVVAAADPGCKPEQPIGTLDVAGGGVPHRQRWQFRRPERRPAEGRDASGLCSDGGDHGGGWAGRNGPYTAAPLSHLEHYLTRTLATGAPVAVSAAAPSDPPRPDPPSADVTDLPLPAFRELAAAEDLGTQTELGERYQGGYGGRTSTTRGGRAFRRKNNSCCL